MGDFLLPAAKYNTNTPEVQAKHKIQAFYFDTLSLPHVTHSYTSILTPAFLIPSPSVSSACLLLFSSHVTTCWSLPGLLCVWFERRRSFRCTAFGPDCIALHRCGQRSCQPLVISDSSWFSTILEGKYVPLAQHIVFSQGHSSVDATTNPKFPSTCLMQSLEYFVLLTLVNRAFSTCVAQGLKSFVTHSACRLFTPLFLCGSSSTL